MATVEARDISGCATAELAAVFHRYKAPKSITSRAWVADRFPDMDERSFEKIVDEVKYPFTGLRFVDAIVHGLGLNLNTLTSTGELTIIPSADKGAAMKMVHEEIAASLEVEIESLDLGEDQVADLVKARMLEMGEAEITSRVARLNRLRETLCVESPEQRALLDRDAARSRERRRRSYSRIRPT